MTVEIRAPGLRNILQEIRKNPRDTLLADRFLSLCSELADHDDDKLVALLIYADILSDVDYKKSLNIAYQIYSHSLVYDEIALELIAEIFQKIGKKESSDTVTQELQKLIERKQIQAKTQLIPPEAPRSSSVGVENQPLVKTSSEYLRSDPMDMKIRFKMSDVVESEEKLMETMLYDLIGKEQFDDAEDLLARIEKQFPERFWAQKARDLIDRKLTSAIEGVEKNRQSQSVEVPPANMSVSTNKDSDFNSSALMLEIQSLMGNSQYRRAFLKLRRFVLEELSEQNVAVSDIKSIVTVLKECVHEQGLILPKEVLKDKVSAKDLKEALSRRLEQKLQSVLL